MGQALDSSHMLTIARRYGPARATVSACDDHRRATITSSHECARETITVDVGLRNLRKAVATARLSRPRQFIRAAHLHVARFSLKAGLSHCATVPVWDNL
jgi:hypothetical protein